MSNLHDVSDLPDDFFNDLADERFIEEVVHGNESDDDISNYVAEITKLQKDIEIRKKKIKNAEASLTKRRRSHSHSRSSSPSRSKSRKHREREKEKDIKRRRTRSRSRSPEARHSRYDERIREKRYPLSPVRRPGRGLSPSQARGRPLRRSRSNSPSLHNPRGKRSSSTHKNLTFLEELAQKFAEKGQAFPEKDALLMGQNHMNNQDASIAMNAYGNQIPFSDQQMIQQSLINLPNYLTPQIGFSGQSNNLSYYGLNPMSILAGNAIPPPAANMANLPFLSETNIGQQNEIQPNLGNPPQTTAPPITNQQKALIERCDQAIKLIRAKENKVPIMKCMYNRTSLVSSNSYDLGSSTINKSPLNSHSTLNISFKLNAKPNLYVKTDGLKMLPKRVRDVAVALGINSPFLFEKMRKKELNAQITSDIHSGIDNVASQVELLIQTRTDSIPAVETNSIAIQTEFNCEKCLERDSRMMVNVPTQTTLKSISIGIQTNEKDYREPIVELLSRMTAAQLVAIKDFANIVDEPRPRNHEEMFKIRERLMDIYSLSQRDADTVRAAEDNRIDGGQFIDDLRFTGNRDSRDIDVYSEGHSRDFNRGSNSPRFNGNNMMNRNSSRNSIPNDQWDDNPPSRAFERRLTPEQEEELERRRYMEEEQKRLENMEMVQKRYDEEREQRRMHMEPMEPNFQRPNQAMSFDEDARFNREPDDRDMQRGKTFNSNRGGTTPNNRRGRGAFRDNFRGGRGNSRRLI